MGLAFKADIDDLRESPAKYIAEKIVSEFPEACLIVEPNISQHPQFQLSETGYAYRQADIIAFWLLIKSLKHFLMTTVSLSLISVEYSKNKLDEKNLIHFRNAS